MRWYGCRQLAHGNCTVPITYKTSTDFALGRWITSQRDKQNSLSEYQKNRLNSLGFDWNPLLTKWNNAFHELEVYHETNGNCMVLATYKTSTGFGLGTWVHNQRHKKDKLTLDRIQRLDALGFVWKIR